LGVRASSSFTCVLERKAVTVERLGVPEGAEPVSAGRGRIVDNFGGNRKWAKIAVFQGANPVFGGARAVRGPKC